MRQHPPRVLSAMRPMGALHLGHYHGVLKNWVRLQPDHDCFFFVADWHALTDAPHTDEPRLEAHIYDMVVDWLAAGIDPARSTLFLQSRLPEHAELFTLLGMVTRQDWLREMPGAAEAGTFGQLAYPLLQAADILIHRADFVPVAEDQEPLIELTRRIAHHFNGAHGGAGTPVLTEPQLLVTNTGYLPGLDGRKMSSRAGNAIAMRDTPEAVTAKVRAAPTTPGTPERCGVFTLHQTYVDADSRRDLERRCTEGSVDCLSCKQPLIEAIVREQTPFRERADTYLAQPKQVQWLLELGTERARGVARETMKHVRRALHLGPH